MYDWFVLFSLKRIATPHIAVSQLQLAVSGNRNDSLSPHLRKRRVRLGAGAAEGLRGARGLPERRRRRLLSAEPAVLPVLLPERTSTHSLLPERTRIVTTAAPERTSSRVTTAAPERTSGRTTTPERRTAAAGTAAPERRTARARGLSETGPCALALVALRPERRPAG